MKPNDNGQPAPKPRKHPQLWQAYLWWNELMQMRKRHVLRLSAIERGASKMSAAFEETIISELTPMEATAEKILAQTGRVAGPVWDWLTGIRGIGNHTAAKLLAIFNDPALFSTPSKFIRFAGWAVIDGEIERCKRGEESHYARRLKSECWIMAKNFVLQQTPVYVEIYYGEKERQRELHPSVECTKCEATFTPDIKKCPRCGQTNEKHGLRYSDAHLDSRARRYMIKKFLQHLWLVWRESEGLPVTEPYVQAILGHTHIIPPPGWPLEPDRK